MAIGSSPTTTTQSAVPVNQFPTGSILVPGTPDLITLEGGPASQDGNGNWTAPASTYVKDGGNIAQGATSDVVWSGSGAATVVSILKKIVAELAATLAVSGTVTANAGTNLNTSTLAVEAGGNLSAINAALGTQADGTWSGSGSGTEIAILKKIVAELAATLTVSGAVTANAGTNLNTSALAVETGGHLASIDAVQGTVADAAYSGSGSGTEIAILKKIVAELAATLTVTGAVTANAGTNLNTSALAVETGGNLATLATRTPALGQTTASGSRPVVLASDQSPLVTSTATRTNVAASASDQTLLASNASRKGAAIYNDSTSTLYVALGSAAASSSSYTLQVLGGGFFELPPAPIFTGAIHGIWVSATGNARITELT